MQNAVGNVNVKDAVKEGSGCGLGVVVVGGVCYRSLEARRSCGIAAESTSEFHPVVIRRIEKLAI